MADPNSPFASPLYELIRSSIDARYPEVDALLRECGLENCDEFIYRRGQLKQDMAGRAYLESVDCRMLPFNRKDIASILWSCVGMETGHSSLHQVGSASRPAGESRSESHVQCVGQKRETSEDFVHSWSRHKFFISRSETIATVHLVVKRFEERGRIVFLWEQYTETEGMLSLRLQGKGIYLVRSPVGSDGSRHGSVAQSYLMQMAPEADELGSYQDDVLQELTKVVLSSYYCNLDMVQHVIETVLLSNPEGN